MEISLRNAFPEDGPRLAELIRDSFRDVADRFGLTPDNAPTHPSNCKSEWVLSAMEKGISYFISEADGKPCGCVALERATAGICYLERLAVLPGFRKKRFGQRLLDHAVAQAKSLGLSRMEIGIIADQEELRAWYEKRGFSMKSRKHFKHLPFEVMFMFMAL